MTFTGIELQFAFLVFESPSAKQAFDNLIYQFAVCAPLTSGIRAFS